MNDDHGILMPVALNQLRAFDLNPRLTKIQNMMKLKSRFATAGWIIRHKSHNVRENLFILLLMEVIPGWQYSTSYGWKRTTKNTVILSVISGSGIQTGALNKVIYTACLVIS